MATLLYLVLSFAVSQKIGDLSAPECPDDYYEQTYGMLGAPSDEILDRCGRCKNKKRKGFWIWLGVMLAVGVLIKLSA